MAMIASVATGADATAQSDRRRSVRTSPAASTARRETTMARAVAGRRAIGSGEKRSISATTVRARNDAEPRSTPAADST